MKDSVSVGIIGAGAILDHHLEALCRFPRFRIAGVADADPERRSARAEALGCPGFEDSAALLAEKPDVVLVLLPHDLHHPVTMQALAAGCHVVVEKPMALGAAECGEMIAEACRRGRALVVADTASSTPGAVRTGEKYRAGSLGRFLAGSVINVRHYFDDTRPAWFLDPARSGGGMFANLGVHRLALVRACLPGLRPTSVSAAQARIDARPVEACTTAFVRYGPEGAMQFQELGYFPPPSWLAAGIHFVFENGIVSWDETRWRMHGGHDGYDEPLASRPVQYLPVYEGLEAALTGSGPLPSAEGNAWDVAAAQAAYESARRGKEIIVDVPNLP